MCLNCNKCCLAAIFLIQIAVVAVRLIPGKMRLILVTVPVSANSQKSISRIGPLLFQNQVMHWGTSTTYQPWQIHGNVATAHILILNRRGRLAIVASYGSLCLSLSPTHTHTFSHYLINNGHRQAKLLDAPHETSCHSRRRELSRNSKLSKAV